MSLTPTGGVIVYAVEDRTPPRTRQMFLRRFDAAGQVTAPEPISNGNQLVQELYMRLDESGRGLIQWQQYTDGELDDRVWENEIR